MVVTGKIHPCTTFLGMDHYIIDEGLEGREGRGKAEGGKRGREGKGGGRGGEGRGGEKRWKISKKK